MEHTNSIVYMIYQEGIVVAIFDDHEEALDMLCEDMLLYTAIVPDFRVGRTPGRFRFFAVIGDADAEVEKNEAVKAIHSTYEGARDSEYLGEFDHIVEFAV